MKRKLSFKSKKKIDAKIKSELDAFIKKHKDQIVTRGREDLGSKLSARKIYNMFKANFRERLSQTNNEYSIVNARKAMRETLHSETFTGARQIESENVRIGLINADKWNEFRKLNRRQKVDIEGFEKVKAPTGVRNRWKYSTIFSRIIVIDLIYHADGSFEYKLSYE